MYTEYPINDRFSAAYRSGFDYVEWLFPYAHEISDIESWLQDSGLRLVLINSALGDPHRGDRGIGALPDRVDDFRSEFELSLRYADALNVRNIHVMAGIVPPTLSVKECRDTFIENLKWAINLAKGTDVRLLIEPLNHQDSPNYLHTTCSESMQVLREVDGLALQFDFYHLQITEGNLAHRIREHFDDIGHVQFSSVPGRHEPQYGEVNVDFLFGVLESLNYDGFIGCEYTPMQTTQEGLGWATKWGIKPRN